MTGEAALGGMSGPKMSHERRPEMSHERGNREAGLSDQWCGSMGLKGVGDTLSRKVDAPNWSEPGEESDKTLKTGG